MLESNKLVDVEPIPFLPTWSNGIFGDSYIAKRLDRFWAAENLISKVRKFRSWVASDIISNHSPIVLHLDFESEKGSYPFKFNHN